MPPGGNGSQEIARGTAITAANGTFNIEFNAKPDPSVLEEAEPTFQFAVFADVTDTTGETRSNRRTINVGYTALAASMSADNWLTDNQAVEINVRTLTLDGEGQAAIGKIKLYEVKQPDEVTRGSLGSDRYRAVPNGNDPEPDPSNPNSWPLGEVIHETDFETNASGSTTIAIELAVGMYRANWKRKIALGNRLRLSYRCK